MSYGWSDVDATAKHHVDQPRAVTAEGARVAYVWDERLTEWYVNDARGLEHGYTVHERPAPARGALSLELAIRGGLAPIVSASGRDVHLADASGAVVLDYAGLAVFDADGGAVDCGFTLDDGRLRLSVADEGARYPLTIDPVVQRAYLKASNSESSEWFGCAVAASGDTVVVGAYLEDSNATGVNGNQSNNSAFAAGAAYVFVRSGGSWSQQAYLKASNTDAGDFFGYAVAISGDTIVVGAYFEDSGATGVNGNESDNSRFSAGAAYVFTRSGTTWSQQAYLKASDTGFDDRFGYSVAIDGDTIAVGAFLEDSSATGVDGDDSDNSAFNAGAAYVFTRSGTTWSQQAYLKASNTESDDYFGYSVAIDGDTAVVGAYREDSNATGVNGNEADNSAFNAGAAYVFTRSGATWSQQAYLKASNTDSDDWFGYAVAASGDTVVVGAHLEDSNATGVNGNESDDSVLNAGAAYAFLRSGTIWSQQAYLKASNTGGTDYFGYSVALDADQLVVGAYLEDSNATGVDGNQGNDSAGDSGAAYAFARSGATWSQLAYLKASNTDSGDSFGYAVALSGDLAIVGAPVEASNATGVNGNQSDDSATAAGAAYLFDLDYQLGSFATYGSGTPGKGGFVPSITLSGSWAIGEDVTLSIRDGLGGAPALLIMGFARATIPFAGGSLLVATPWILTNLPLGGTPGVAGAGALDVTDTIPDDPTIVGVLVDFQVLVADPAAVKKLALSNGAELLIGG
ncbi:MAG: FG-GAP repeat protein [Planctomycetes bacterium]|nr:FG-GAP repeat protein [Planctomycetota bacterium]